MVITIPNATCQFHRKNVAKGGCQVARLAAVHSPVKAPASVLTSGERPSFLWSLGIQNLLNYYISQT